jgi:hypothetical protein
MLRGAQAGRAAVLRGEALLRLVQSLAHFLAGLEERHRLLVHRHMRAGARIASGARRAVLDRERAEAAQLDPVAARERRRDLASPSTALTIFSMSR